jgi:uncharacterized delta-60 repeat protein
MSTRLPCARSLVVAAFTLLLAACGGGSDSPVAQAPGPDAPPAGGGAPAPQPVAQFTVDLALDKAIVFQGSTAIVRAQVLRSGGFDGAVTLTLGGLPAGVSASPAVVAAGANQVDITLVAEAAAPHSLPTAVEVEGRALIDGNTQRASKSMTLTVRGVAGMVDTSFAGGAFLTRVGDSEDYAHAVAVQPDGKVLVAGSAATPLGTRIAVVRYLRDGTLDASFGSGGKAVAAVGSGDDAARAIAVQPDGRIVVAGLSQQRQAGADFAMLRFMPDGTPDASFGQQGRVLTDFGGDSDRAFALLVQPDGRIVAAGQTNVNGATTGLDFALARYLADGRLDAGFGSGGKVVAPMLAGSSSDMVRGLALQTIGGSARLLAVGGEGDFTAARFTDDGRLDTGFGQGGKVLAPFGSNIGAAHAVAVLPTGEAVIAGHVGHDFAAVRLLADGRLDTRFGPQADGRFVHAMAAENWDQATAIAVQADGKLLLAGWLYTGQGTSGDFAALRLQPDGRLDAGFGRNGTMTHAVAGSRTDLGHAIVLQADERISTVRAIVAGEGQDANRDFALMRLWL